ncbi:MAG: hypothetical protein LBR84_01215, partial [Tannerella sp.]|nr:hypothetical protein [Tannerella sp.]
MKKSVFYILLFFSLTQCSDTSIGDDINLLKNSTECFPYTTDKYIYPIQFGSEEWMALTDEEKENYSQLPQEVLTSISTCGLIQSLLDKPALYLDYMASSNTSPVVTAERFVFSHHNSIPEFDKRKDRVEALMSFYELSDCECIHDIGFATQLVVLETLFTRKSINDALNATQKKKIVSLLLDKYGQETSTGFSCIGATTAMTVIMYRDDYAPIVSYFNNSEP